MPLIMEDESKNSTGFDVQTATTLFWKPVPVLLKQLDREDMLEDLTFRILTGFARQNHNLRILRIHISSDSDHYFLHSLEVSEEEFQSLKNEQGILVDFASFPGKIISLLERCTCVQPVDSPRFQSVLVVRGSESVFRIMETNDFKQLPHITLAFRPGNDAAVKQFLAFRLLEVKSDHQGASEELAKTKDERDSHSGALLQCRHQLAELREQHDKHTLEVAADSKTQAATAHEERARERAAMKEQHEREREEQERRSREQMDAINARLGELDVENRKLREAKYGLDSKVSELSHRLASSEGGQRALEEEHGRLKASHGLLVTEKHERDISLNEAKARWMSLEEKVLSQAEVVEQQRSRIRDLDAAVKTWEERCADLRLTSSGHDARAKEATAEVVKGNGIIEKLASEARVSKDKVKRKMAIVVKQEEVLAAREASLAAAVRESQALGSAVEALRGDLAGLKSDNAELRAKLEDSKLQLQSNEQMIRWLNSQVTEAQLQSSGSVPGSRYTSFRPHLGLPSSSTLPITSTTTHTPVGGLVNPTSYTRDPIPSSSSTPALSLLAGPGSGSNNLNGGSGGGAPFVSKYISGMGLYGATGAGNAQKGNTYQPANSPLRGGVGGGAGASPFGSGPHQAAPSAYSFGSDVGGGSSQYPSVVGEAGSGGGGGGASQYQYQAIGAGRGVYDGGGGGGGGSTGYLQAAAGEGYSYGGMGESTPLPTYRGGSYTSTGGGGGRNGGGAQGLQ
ncbi:MAG: hypothetical protein WDW36_002505 [Sanguina aurantia]